MKEPSYPEDLNLANSEILKERNPASAVSALLVMKETSGLYKPFELKFYAP